MDIAAHGERDDLLAVGHHHQAGLVVEIDESLQNAGHRQQRQRLVEVRFRAQHRLTVAVVAQRAGLQHAGIAQLRHSPPQPRFVVDRRIGRSLEAMGPGVLFLAQAILRVVERPEPLRNVVFFGQRDQHPARHVLEFVGHRIAPPAQFFEGRRIVVGRHDAFVAHGKGRSVGRRVERHGAHAEPARLLRDHQPQLAASYDADGLHPKVRLSVRRTSASLGTLRACRPALRPAGQGSKRRSAQRSSLR